MKVVHIGLLLTLSLGLLGCAVSSESYLRAGYDFSGLDQVAIMDVVGVIQCEGVKKQIEDGFTAQFLQKGYAPVVREYVRRRLDQNGFDGRDLSPEVYAIEAGRVLGVPAVLVISVPTFGDEISMTAKLIEVEAGSVLWMGHASKRRQDSSFWETKEDTFNDEFEQAMMAGYGNQVGYDGYYDNGSAYQDDAYPQETPEPLDCTLTPDEEKQVYALTRVICESLPQKPLEGMGGDLYDMQNGSIFDITPPRPPAQQREPSRSRTVQPKPHKKFDWRSLID